MARIGNTRVLNDNSDEILHLSTRKNKSDSAIHLCGKSEVLSFPKTSIGGNPNKVLPPRDNETNMKAEVVPLLKRTTSSSSTQDSESVQTDKHERHQHDDTVVKFGDRMHQHDETVTNIARTGKFTARRKCNYAIFVFINIVLFAAVSGLYVYVFKEKNGPSAVVCAQKEKISIDVNFDSFDNKTRKLVPWNSFNSSFVTIDGYGTKLRVTKDARFSVFGFFNFMNSNDRKLSIRVQVKTCGGKRGKQSNEKIAPFDRRNVWFTADFRLSVDECMFVEVTGIEYIYRAVDVNMFSIEAQAV